MQNRGKSIPGGGKNWPVSPPRQGKKRKEARVSRRQGGGQRGWEEMAQDNLLVAGGA